VVQAALLDLTPWIGSLVLENWPADRSTHKNANDINSTVEAVSLVALSSQVDFLDDDFDTRAVRAVAHDETGWMLHEHEAQHRNHTNVAGKNTTLKKKQEPAIAPLIPR
jgi:hypothetical protein